jgi:hypothetical protein
VHGDQKTVLVLRKDNDLEAFASRERLKPR